MDSLAVLHKWIEDSKKEMEITDDRQHATELYRSVHHQEINMKRTEYLIEQGHYHHFCKDCGVIEFATYDPSTKEKLKESQLCFGCNLWGERCEKLLTNPGKSIIVNGVLWTDGGKKTDISGEFLGCAGQTFKIRKLDGSKEWETNNLWCGGDIPKKYRETVLKDDAEFIY